MSGRLFKLKELVKRDDIAFTKVGFCYKDFDKRDYSFGTETVLLIESQLYSGRRDESGAVHSAQQRESERPKAMLGQLSWHCPFAD